MTNFFGVNFTNATKMTSTEGDTANVPLEVIYIITIIINSIACPFTVLLNVLVIMTVMVVTFERLLVIKFTMRYLNIITEKNIKIAVTVFWIIAFTSGVFRLIRIQGILVRRTLALVVISCILFVVFSYVILYRETRRHKKKLKTQQLPQEEVERFTKENKALLTTVYVVGAVILCLLPVIILALQ